MTRILRSLPRVTETQRKQIAAAPRSAGAHRALLAGVPAMSALETGGAAPLARLPGAFTVAAWNVERCLFPEASAALLAPHAPAIVLLSEMDSGMARTGQRNTTADMASALGMAYAYGVEFFELGLGGSTERQFCKDNFNARGWHGNAILSSAPFERLALMRLDEDGHWFTPAAGSSEQPRLGGRMAVTAIVPGADGQFCVVSTHLESNAGAEYRHAQFSRLLDLIDDFAPGLPVLIGGDLNTGNHVPPDYDWRAETLFDLAHGRGYHWDLTPEGVTTGPSLITPHQTRAMKLDWFCARGLTGGDPRLLEVRDTQGTALSDHKCILCRVGG